MCELGAIIGLASSVVSGIGAMQQAEAQADAAEYNAKVSDMNARISDRRAKDALERGRQEETNKRYEKAQILGKQRAAMGANGVDASWGSPLDTLIDTAVAGEIDALTIRTNANRESYDYRVQAVNGRADGELKRMEADSARAGGALSMFGTVLGGVGQAYKSYSTSTIGTI